MHLFILVTDAKEGKLLSELWSALSVTCALKTITKVFEIILPLETIGVCACLLL